ncbi:hypothetical protein NT6N_37050 [Oceaniferula spumae]|uniref:DUF455 domain-containing protein n=1 Tax=Oceaniferula spumae TaxID=2979115 RepID=A0AAT9FRK7_9BACT
MQMREAAERLLFSSTLEEKLALAPESVSDDSPGSAILLPDAPGRPDELRMVSKGVRADFPGVNRLDDDRERGKMLHFLANHELLAAELMALVLLKFPDAPKDYRAGVYEAMREEQMHTLMYLRRMKDCGIHFGELPLNDYFWRLIAPMETPMDFVTRLNLTFEQANLDFSKHYAQLFRQVGDTGTAAVLEKIYQDEIGHVGHGVKWFRKWKAEGETDWQAFGKSLTFPLAPAKAKGIAPFNAEGRRLAGLDEDFISHLEVSEQSRGRTPVLHWFNANAESQVAAAVSGRRFDANKMELALEEDLEMLAIAWCRKDDIVLLRRRPEKEHLVRLKEAGLNLPEVVTLDEMDGHDFTSRRLGGVRPWAWSPDAAKLLRPLTNRVSSNVPWQCREPLPAICFSKEIGNRLEELLEQDGLAERGGVFCRNLETATAEIAIRLREGDVLLKAAHACAGRGHRKVLQNEPQSEHLLWIEKILKNHGGLVVEPWLDRVLDFSSLYEIGAAGEVKWIGMTCMENDAHGRFLGTVVNAKWGSDLDSELREFLFRECKANAFYRQQIPVVLQKLFTEIAPDYTGPVGVDAMVFRKPDGTIGLRHVVELNVRMTMGRVALELFRKLHLQSDSSQPGRFRILRKNNLPKELLSPACSQVINNAIIPLNDPATAKAFVAVWES